MCARENCCSSHHDFDIPLIGDVASKHQVFAAGPEVTFPLFATEGVTGLLGARYMWDFDSESTTEGETLLVTFALASL